MTELGIVDLREIFNVINNVYEYDFSQFALTSFKQRLERLMIRNNISNTENLIYKLKNNPEFFDIFLYEISVPSTEMFRDPGLWRWMREELFPDVASKYHGKYKIWLPNCVSGAEVYSLCILLKEIDMFDKVEIIATSVSVKSIEYILEGRYEIKKIEVSNENYRRFHGSRELSDYYELDRYCAFIDTELISSVEFRKQNIKFDNSPQNVKLILFRNNLIYCNPTLQEKMLDLMYSSLSTSGLLVLGIRERIKGLTSTRDFELYNESESVYKKK